MQQQDLINKLKQKLKENLPGQAVQYEMAPVNRYMLDQEFLEAHHKLSAVLLLLCFENDRVFIPLTQRYSYAGAHSGQISLPGGKYDQEDGSLENTALRECFEEIGLKENIELTGGLSKLYIPVSNFMVQPFVGIYLEESPIMLPHEREVKQILKLYIDDLLDDTLIRKGTVLISDERKIKAPYFEIEGLQVWGATAMILNEFKAVLKSIY